MKNKYTLLAVLLSLGMLSCSVDPKEIVKLPELTTVKVPVNEPSGEIIIEGKEWEKIYEIDLLNDPQYAEYKDVVKDIKLNGVSYVITSYPKDEVVKGGDVEIHLGDQLPEINKHADFFNDFTEKTPYTFNNKEKIAVAQAVLSKDKKIIIKAKVILEDVPTSPITISFDFKLDVDLGVDLNNLK
mgnify:FL=1